MTLISNWTQTRQKDSKTQDLPNRAVQQLQDGAELFQEEEEKEDKNKWEVDPSTDLSRPKWLSIPPEQRRALSWGVISWAGPSGVVELRHVAQQGFSNQRLILY